MCIINKHSPVSLDLLLSFSCYSSTESLKYTDIDVLKKLIYFKILKLIYF